jgi:hypothetical protein
VPVSVVPGAPQVHEQVRVDRRHSPMMPELERAAIWVT